jgi:hypothetical protein
LLPEVDNEFIHGFSPYEMPLQPTSEPSNAIERCIAPAPGIAELLIPDRS